MGLFSSLRKRFSGLKTPEDVIDLEEIVFETIEADDLANSQPNALYELFKSEKHGFLVKNFLNEKEVKKLQDFAQQNKSRNPAHTPVGYTYPMIFQEFFLSNEELDEPTQLKNRKQYFEDNDKFDNQNGEILGVDLNKKLASFLKEISGGRDVMHPKGIGDEGAYLFGNFRHLFPTGGYMAVHCGNFFQTKFISFYKHMMKEIKVFDQMSYFIMIQEPESGGELTLFNLRWKDNQDKVNLSEDELVTLSSGKKIRIDEHPAIKQFKISPSAGDMILFQGGNIWHRVEPVYGEKERITFGGFMGMDHKEEKFYYWT